MGNVITLCDLQCVCDPQNICECVCVCIHLTMSAFDMIQITVSAKHNSLVM